PGIDGRSARPEGLVLPPVAVERPRGAARERAIWPLHLERELLHARVGLAPHELQVRALRARVALAHEIGHLLVGEQTEDLGLDEALREALAPAPVACGPEAASEVEHVVHLARQAGVRRRAAALVREGRDRDLPDLCQLAHIAIALHSP